MPKEEQDSYEEYMGRIRSERVPHFDIQLGQAELDQLAEVVRSGWISEGVKTREFERLVREFFGLKHAVALATCTAALMLGQKALGVQPGDEVIVPTFTHPADVNAIAVIGAVPVFVDIDRRTLTLDPAAVERAVTPRTKAMNIVHLYGHAADMDGLMAVARRHKLGVIEDCAQAIGVTWNGRHVGTFGDVACVSFFADKSITTGEGGMLLTNSPDIVKEVELYKHDGRRERGVDVIERRGYNFRITELQAALGVAQVPKLRDVIRLKRRNEELYRRGLEGVEQVAFPFRDPRCFVVPHRVNVLVEEPQKLIDYLGEYGIGCRRFYIPMHRQPCYNEPG
ncbi:MAG: DegT/DnrJ/EryC1/StrS family aminotransferase, partial [Chloroflexota bacterium]|nr:DegT/DnrJ/EryC1/StrS family aminotransferase [Chloroflexota bacterium]